MNSRSLYNERRRRRKWRELNFGGAAPAVATPWYLAGGVPAANCVAAYQAKGAADYATSLVNLANPGTYDLVDVTEAPAWDATNGWSITLGNGVQSSNILALTKFSILIYFLTTVEPSGGNALTACGFSSFAIYPIADFGEGGPYGVGYGTSYAYGAEPILSSGVLGLTSDASDGSLLGYRNGVLDYSGNDLSPHSESPLIMINNDIDIYAVSLYNTILTAPQVAAITTAMQAL